MKFRDFQKLSPAERKAYWEAYKKRLTAGTVNH
nr:MAG TPA: arginine decarboxylase [Caudoviricetes sp.]